MLTKLKKSLQDLADPQVAGVNARFFKPNSDNFLGIRVPVLRKLSKVYKELAYADILQLLKSAFNEERLLALLILTLKYKASPKEVYDFYIANRRFVNNWNLVDLSAYQIVGDYIINRDRSLLIDLAQSKNLWDRRIAIVSTYAFIKQSDLDYTIKIAEVLLGDQEDLLHKATGWMLREVGKKDVLTLQAFLDRYAAKMPRTMLRYSIERFPEQLRKKYLSARN